MVWYGMIWYGMVRYGMVPVAPSVSNGYQTHNHKEEGKWLDRIMIFTRIDVL